MGIQDEDKRLAAVQEIVDNGDLKTSVFMTDLMRMVNTFEKEEEGYEEDGYEDLEMVSEYTPAADSL